MFFGIRVCTPKTVNWSCKRNQNQLTDRHSDIDILGSLLAASLEPLAHCQNVTNLSLSYRHFFGRCSPELAQLVPLLFSQGGLLVILINCMIFLSPFLHVTRISMSTVSFLTQLDSGIPRL